MLFFIFKLKRFTLNIFKIKPSGVNNKKNTEVIIIGVIIAPKISPTLFHKKENGFNQDGFVKDKKNKAIEMLKI